MKKLLFQFDTDHYPSVFDNIVAYDGGAEHVIGHGGLNPENVKSLVEGAIFTRAPKDKKNTAIFVGGSDMSAGEALFNAVRNIFFPGFQVAIMLDSNGSNTTAAAGVAKLGAGIVIAGKKAVVLAGTGPVGQRAAALLAREGAEVSLTSRQWLRAENACTAIAERFGVKVKAVEAPDQDARGLSIAAAQIVFAAGATGVELINAEHWQNNSAIEIMADANATPPIGIGGIDMLDNGNQRHGKIIWGAIGFGTLKLALHRACIAKLFTDNKLVLDAEEIFSLAKEMT